MDLPREMLYVGRDAWNTWRQAHHDAHLRPDLTGIHLSKFSDDPDLSGYDLSGAQLRGAVLSKISLMATDLTDADCRDVHISAANLQYCNLTNADLRKAKLFNCFLRHANLTGTNLVGATLSNVDFEGVTLDQTIFGNDDLSGVVNLQRAVIRGSVVIGARALEESRGRISPTFLVNAQVPAEIVKVALAWGQQPVAFLSCFISHSSEDRKFVDQLQDRLTDSGVETFLSSRNLTPGQRYPDEIKEQLLAAGRVIVVVSRSALKSRWVAREIRTATARERREGQFRIIPVIRMAADDWKQSRVAWARSLHEYVHAVNFHRRTGTEAFEGPYRTLLAALRIAASGGKPG